MPLFLNQNQMIIMMITEGNVIMNNYDLAVQIAKKVNEIGGAAYFVGGYVRDKLLGIPNRDIDIEIHNINPEVLENFKRAGRSPIKNRRE